MKRICCCLFLCMCLLIPVEAKADVFDFFDDVGEAWQNMTGVKTAEGLEGVPDGLKYYLQKDGTVQIEGWTGSDKVLTIPEFIDGAPVASIAEHAFAEVSTVEKIVLPSTVTEIGDCAFMKCFSLSEIETAGDNPAFTSVDGILMTASMDKIVCFPEKKNLSSYTVPEGVTEIGSAAFAYARYLTKISLPDTVKSIDDFAFACCVNVEKLGLPEGLKRIGMGAFSHCSSLKQVTLPEGITQIPSMAFYNCRNLQKMTISENVTSIDDWAFSYCISLEKIAIPEKTVYLGKDAFSGCASLETVTIKSPELDMTDAWQGYKDDPSSLTLKKFIIPESSWTEQQIIEELGLPYEYLK